MTEQSKLEWTEYKSRFRAVTAYGTYWVDTFAGSKGYQLICGTNPCCEVFSSPLEAKDCAQMIHDRPPSREQWFNLSDVPQAPYHAPLCLSELLRTYETLLAGDNLPERIAVQTVDLRAILGAVMPLNLADENGSMTQEEIRLEDLKQMASYAGPIVSFETRAPYYLASCDSCGWVGSSELCGTDSYGDDSDVYCPRCQSSGADCGKVAEHLSTKPVDVVAGLEQAANFIDQRLSDYVQEHGTTDPSTGIVELPGWGDEYVSTLEDLAEDIRAISPAKIALADHWHDISSVGEREHGRLIIVGAYDAKGRWRAVVRRARRFMEIKKETCGSLKKAMRLKWEPTHFMEMTAPHSSLLTVAPAQNNSTTAICTHCVDTKEVRHPDCEFVLPCPECATTKGAGQ